MYVFLNDVENQRNRKIHRQTDGQTS